jgi:hypothetical protein
LYRTFERFLKPNDRVNHPILKCWPIYLRCAPPTLKINAYTATATIRQFLPIELLSENSFDILTLLFQCVKDSEIPLITIFAVVNVTFSPGPIFGKNQVKPAPRPSNSC